MPPLTTFLRRATFQLLPALLLLAALPAAQAQDHSLHATPAHDDPRVGLKAGWKDAEVAAMNVTLVGHVDRAEGFYNPDDIGDFGFMNSDLAFSGDTMFVGNFSGLQVYDISDLTNPTLRLTISCYGGQGDVSVYKNLLFMSVEETRGLLSADSTHLAPASSAFMIWSVIYTGLGAYTLWQWWDRRDARGIGQRHSVGDDAIGDHRRREHEELGEVAHPGRVADAALQRVHLLMRLDQPGAGLL